MLLHVKSAASGPACPSNMANIKRSGRNVFTLKREIEHFGEGYNQCLKLLTMNVIMQSTRLLYFITYQVPVLIFFTPSLETEYSHLISGDLGNQGAVFY